MVEVKVEKLEPVFVFSGLEKIKCGVCKQNILHLSPNSLYKHMKFSNDKFKVFDHKLNIIKSSYGHYCHRDCYMLKVKDQTCPVEKIVQWETVDKFII